MSASIVLTVCEQLKIHPNEFFGPGRDPRLSRARRLAIDRLRAAGFTTAGIARMIKRNYSTVQYWTHESYRKRRLIYYRELRASRKQAA